MGKRKAIGKKLRFEIFKRDKFTCQYCGARSPDVVLQVDHVQPVSKGGDNDALNLVTSCFDCNSGKSNRELSDDTVISKQMDQLAELQECHEQLEMLMRWKRGLADLEETGVQEVEAFLQERFGRPLSDFGREQLRKFVKKHGIPQVLDAIPVAEQYLSTDADGEVTSDSFSEAFNKIPGICGVAKVTREKPYMKELFYIRGILRNRLHYCNNGTALALLEEAYLAGVASATLRRTALEAGSWSGWQSEVYDLMEATRD